MEAAKQTAVRKDGYLEFEAQEAAWPLSSNGAILTTANGIIEGREYLVSAKVKQGRPNTSMTFQLWLHDSKENNNMTEPQFGFKEVTSEYDEVMLVWRATHTNLLSIHLHCKAGTGSIFVREVKVILLGKE